MFTGLVQTIGQVREIHDDGHGGCLLGILEPKLAPQLVLGESIAVNGCCLTVVRFDTETMTFQAGPETLARTNLGGLRQDDRVNIERALRIGDALGGHFVSGHVDAVGVIQERTMSGEWEMVRFQYPREFAHLLVPKGSIAIDGISLTLVEVGDDSFTVMLIPHTRQETTLGQKTVGAAVNLEFDLLAKHVDRLLAHRFNPS